MTTNLPPGGGFSLSDHPIACSCANGHSWEAAGYFELGGAFFVDEENGPICPECGEEDVGPVKPT